jgi:hypothetical protein
VRLVNDVGAGAGNERGNLDGVDDFANGVDPARLGGVDLLEIPGVDLQLVDHDAGERRFARSARAGEKEGVRQRAGL